VVSAGAVSHIAAGQNTWYGDAYDPYKDAGVLMGVGQTAGAYTYVDEWGTHPVCSWTQPVLLAQGICSGSGGFLVGSAQGTVLQSNWSGPENTAIADVIMQVGGSFPFPASMGGTGLNEFIPEPGTLILLACGGVALIRRRRK
jgi:hypothetical protein